MTMDDSRKNNFDEELVGVPSRADGDVQDAVFGNVDEGGPNYLSVGWLGASVLMMKTEVGLGVLSIPGAFDILGMIPGIIILLAIGGITTWSSYVVGQFKLNHPQVYGIPDVGMLMWGPIGRDILAVAFCLFWVFIAGSAMLGVSIGLNAVSTHGACTAIFVAIAAIIAVAFASIRTLGKVSALAWIGMASILAAIFAVTIATGVQDRPAAAPQTGDFKSNWELVGHPSFYEAMSAISSLIFAFAGVPAYFSIASEMRNPRHYSRSLFLCRGVAIGTYLIIGIVVYYYCGSYVASPALGSAGALMKKVSYGLALPGLCVSMVLYTHLTAKYVFIRIMRNSKHLTSNSFVHWSTWIACTTSTALIAYCIASGIPAFGGLVSLMGAVFGTLMCFQPMGAMWFYDNWNRSDRGSVRWKLMCCWAAFVIFIGTFLMVAGTYGSVVSLIDIFAEDSGAGAWTCVDNSNSV
jgi:amino acid permease